MDLIKKASDSATTYTKEKSIIVKSKVTENAKNTIDKISEGSKIFGGYIINKAKEA